MREVEPSLQVETWSHDDTRLHAASCILQVGRANTATYYQTNRQTGKQANKQTNKQANKLTNKQTIN